MQSTVGIDFLTKIVECNGQSVRLQFWDTAGQERFRSMIPSFLRDTRAFIIMYDLTIKDSFNNVCSWYEQVKESSAGEPPIFLVANKIDKEELREVQPSEGEETAKLING